MAIARVNFVQGANSVVVGSSVTITGTTAGNSLVILTRWTENVTISSITCSGETIVGAGTRKTDYPFYQSCSQWHVIDNLQTGGSKQINVTLSATPNYQNCVSVWEVSGADTAGIYDAIASATGSSSAPSTSLTTGVSGAAIFALAAGTSSKPTAGSNYTAEGAANILQYDNCEYDVDVGGAGSKTVDFGGSQTNWGLHAISIKPLASGNIDLTGSSTAGATGSATITVQRNLASAAVAGALASGTLKIDRALTSSAIGAALGAATLSAFTKVWRVPTNAPNGTTVKIMIVSGTSPNYTIAQQGTAVVAGGYADLPTDGTPGTLSFAFMHNYNDNTATTSIYGGGYIATLTSI